MIRQLGHAEFVIGSRYMRGGFEQTLFRRALSRGANGLARLLLDIPVHETTTSFRGFRRSLLERLDMDAVQSDGYSFFVESIYQVKARARAGGGARAMTEFPIHVADRRAGATKISRIEIWRGVTTLARLTANRLGNS